MVPGKYKTAGTVMLVAGLFNVVWSMFLGFFIFTYASILTLGTFGLGIVCYGCMLIPILPLGMGIVEIVVGVQAMNGTPMGPVRNVSILGLIVAVLNLSMIPIFLEVVALMSLNDDEVAGWLEANT